MNARLVHCTAEFSKDIQDGSIIGRYPNVDEEKSVQLYSPRLSRQHARFHRSETDEWYIEDLRSTNGTFVNGQRVYLMQIMNGDRIEVGDFQFDFIID